MTPNQLRAFVDEKPTSLNDDLYAWADEAATYLRQCAEEEPTAWMFKRRYGSGLQFGKPPLTVNEEDEVEYPVPLYTHPAPAQPAPEPVAFMNGDALLSFQAGNDLPVRLSRNRTGWFKTAIYTHPAPKQVNIKYIGKMKPRVYPLDEDDVAPAQPAPEPVSAQQWRDQLRELVAELAVKDARIAALEAQPASEPLTDFEINTLINDHFLSSGNATTGGMVLRFARAVLKAQKEKNGKP